MPFVDILIFAIIAVFLVLRLRNILGTRDGYEQKPDEMYRAQAASEPQSADQDSGSDIIVPFAQKRCLDLISLPLKRQILHFKKINFCKALRLHFKWFSMPMQKVI